MKPEGYKDKVCVRDDNLSSAITTTSAEVADIQ